MQNDNDPEQEPKPERDPRARFYDNPFRPTNLTPEQNEYLDRRGVAFRHYYATGDPSKLKEFGFNLPDKQAEVAARNAKAGNDDTNPQVHTRPISCFAREADLLQDALSLTQRLLSHRIPTRIRIPDEEPCQIRIEVPCITHDCPHWTTAIPDNPNEPDTTPCAIRRCNYCQEHDIGPPEVHQIHFPE